MSWAWDNRDRILDLTFTHMWLSVIPIVLGFLIALPIGWYANRRRWFRGPILGLGSVLYSIPSLPLFVILPSIIGTRILDSTNVVVALTIYATAIMVRSACDAFESVSGSVLDAAEATGYSGSQRGFGVELPLAGPVLLAGLRVVSVSTVSLVSVGALIGVSSLGSFFTDGFQRDFTTEIIVGTVGIVVVALLFDAVLVLAGRVLMPWSRAAKPLGAPA
jgi:osmoprotectant transport system permease protein